MEKRNKIIYWVATALFTVGMFSSGLQQLFQTDSMIELVTALKYPTYLLYILGTWKILGVIAVLIPRFKLLKEWAYAGFFFVMTGALVSHLAMGNYDVKAILGPLFQTIFIITSWYFRPADRKINITISE
jgi:uncharacterized membrane protein YphA (DoxX/SURF4 family)